jgi:hypothetical protein
MKSEEGGEIFVLPSIQPRMMMYKLGTRETKFYVCETFFPNPCEEQKIFLVKNC